MFRAPPQLLRVICLRLLTVKNEANDNFADCLFRREMETIVSVWIFMFLPPLMVLRRAANGNANLFIVFVIHLCFSEATELCGNIEQSHERPSGDCTGTTVKVCIQFDPTSQYSSMTGRCFIRRNKSYIFPGSPIAPRTNSL